MTEYDSPSYVGYFGTDVDNIQGIEITTGISNYKNVAVVAGEEKEGTSRVIRFVSLGELSEIPEENRRELYVDANSVKQDGRPNAVYNDDLDRYGREKLLEHLEDFSVACNVTHNTLKFGKDYFLGDRMPVKLPEYGIYGSVRIRSVLRVYDQDGENVSLELDKFIVK